MKLFWSKLAFPALYLAFGLAVFGVAYSVMGETPSENLPQAPADQTKADDPVSIPAQTPLQFSEEIQEEVKNMPEFHKVIDSQDANLVLAELMKGADPNTTNRYGYSALHWALIGAGYTTKTFGIVQVLLDFGANPNQVNNKGFTPLHYAGQFRADAATMGLLLKYGGDPNIKNNQGVTPYEMALLFGADDAVDAIERQVGTGGRPANYEEMQKMGTYLRSLEAAMTEKALQLKRPLTEAEKDATIDQVQKSFSSIN